MASALARASDCFARSALSIAARARMAALSMKPARDPPRNAAAFGHGGEVDHRSALAVVDIGAVSLFSASLGRAAVPAVVRDEVVDAQAIPGGEVDEVHRFAFA
jgi:hypothetical protein